jgi:hypothetical protein
MTREEWLEHGHDYGWRPPAPAPGWKRLPVIRHIRTWRDMRRVDGWYRHGPGSIGIRSGFDSWVLVGMWRGFI